MDTLRTTSRIKSSQRPPTYLAPKVRHLSPPIVGSRVAGHLAHSDDEYKRIYFGATSDFGQLHDGVWFRMRTSDCTSRADAWRVSTSLCGCRIHLDAVIDDFGNLVAVNS